MIRIRRCAPQSWRSSDARVGWIASVGDDVVESATAGMAHFSQVKFFPRASNVHLLEFRSTGAILSERAAAQVEQSTSLAGRAGGVREISHVGGD